MQTIEAFFQDKQELRPLFYDFARNAEEFRLARADVWDGSGNMFYCPLGLPYYVNDVIQDAFTERGEAVPTVVGPVPGNRMLVTRIIEVLAEQIRHTWQMGNYLRGGGSVQPAHRTDNQMRNGHSDGQVSFAPVSTFVPASTVVPASTFVRTYEPLRANRALTLDSIINTEQSSWIRQDQERLTDAFNEELHEARNRVQNSSDRTHNTTGAQGMNQPTQGHANPRAAAANASGNANANLQSGAGHATQQAHSQQETQPQHVQSSDPGGAGAFTGTFSGGAGAFTG